MPDHPRAALPDAIAAWAVRPRADRLLRLGRTSADLAAAIASRSAGGLVAPSAAEGWGAVHVLGHFRDVEELALSRFRMMYRMDDPSLPAAGMPDDPVAWGLLEDGASLFDPERLAADRQYGRDDPYRSAEAFRRNRERTLAFLDRLTPERWARSGIHPRYGRLTFDGWTAVLAWHDDNHLAQLQRILESGDAGAQPP